MDLQIASKSVVTCWVRRPLCMTNWRMHKAPNTWQTSFVPSFNHIATLSFSAKWICLTVNIPFTQTLIFSLQCTVSLYVVALTKLLRTDEKCHPPMDYKAQ